MTLKNALKKKNVLIGQMKDEIGRLHKYNTVDVVNEKNRPYSPREVWDKIKTLSDELVELKTKIQVSNTPILTKIYRMSELKNMIIHLKELSCENGKMEDRYTEKDKFVVSEISVQERDHLVNMYSEEIDQIQNELDYFNQSTELAA